MSKSSNYKHYFVLLTALYALLFPLFGSIPCEAQSKDSFDFSIPKHIRKYAVDYLEAFQVPRLYKRPASVQREQLKELFIWAGHYDKNHFGVMSMLNRNCALWDVLALEFPGVENVSIETTYTIDVAYVLEHNLTPDGVIKWRNELVARNVSS